MFPLFISLHPLSLPSFQPTHYNKYINLLQYMLLSSQLLFTSSFSTLHPLLCIAFSVTLHALLLASLHSLTLSTLTYLHTSRPIYQLPSLLYHSFSPISFLSSLYYNISIIYTSLLFSPLKCMYILNHRDRKYFSPTHPYEDSPQLLGYGVTISAPHMHGT